MNKKYKKFIMGLEKIPTIGLYIALIGEIDAEFVSDDTYINRGEKSSYYSLVKKEEGNNFYDIFLDKEYSFRDESSFETILKLQVFPSSDYISAYEIQDVIDRYNENIKDIKADNKVYVRTNKRNNYNLTK